MMGTTKNLLMLITHFHSINTVNDFVYGNMLWALAPLRVFICNYVLYSFGLILKYIFRIQIGDRKNEFSVQIEDSEADGFGQELVDFLFRSSEDVVVYEGIEESESEIESSALMESLSDVAEQGIKGEGGTEESVFIHEESKNREGETESDFHEEREGSVSMDGGSNVHEDSEKREEEETESSVFMEVGSNIEEDGKKTENSVSMEEEEEEEETEDSVLTTSKYQYVSDRDISGFVEEPTMMTFSFREFYVGPYVSDTTISELKSEKETLRQVQEEESAQEQCLKKSLQSPETEISEIKSEQNLVIQEEEESVQEQSSPKFHTTSNVSETEIPELKSEEEPILQEEGKEKSVLEQSSPSFHASPNVSEPEISEEDPALQEEGKEESVQSFHASPNVSEKEVSEEEPILQEEGKEDSVQEQRIFHGYSTSDQFSLKDEIFGGSDSSDEEDDDDLDFNDNYFASDSESESSSSSGLIWANSNSKTDDLSITYELLAYQNAFEGFEPESFKMMKKLIAEDEFIELEPSEKNLKTWDTHYFSGKAKGEDEKKDSYNEAEELGELDSDEDEKDDFEWKEDDLVEQIKMELRNARQGGLSTILEEEEEEEESETKSPKVVEDLIKPLKIEEKHEFKDQIGEIKKVHRSYEDKMKKLDILNYQTMHSLGLLQLKDPEAKPVISQNLWPRKALKNSSEPLATFIKELNTELEVVYVGQVCLSWEILCWEHRKAHELKQYDSEWSRQYNIVAGEFQLLQVLMQRFIENEPFQGPRIQNYVKNRCVIRNLLQVPSIKDDSMKDKNMMKKEEEDAVSSEKLAEIIKESMRVFWEFVRADKDDNANLFFKVSHHPSKKHHLKDPAISDLLIDIRTHLHKKEKRLKEIVRSGNCIVRKFQKQNENKVEVDHEQLVAQVEMKLIGRVLNMSKLRKEQLIWCNEKLKRITFVNRKIHVDPSFLLFPF